MALLDQRPHLIIPPMKSPLMLAVAALAHGSRLAAQSAVDNLPAENPGIHLTLVQWVDHAGDAPPADGPRIDPARWIYDEQNPLAPEHAFCPGMPEAPDDDAPGTPVRAEQPAALPSPIPPAGWIVRSVPPTSAEASAAPVPEPSVLLLFPAAWAAWVGWRRRV